MHKNWQFINFSNASSLFLFVIKATNKISNKFSQDTSLQDTFIFGLGLTRKT